MWVHQFSDALFVSRSDDQRLPLARANWRGTVVTVFRRSTPRRRDKVLSRPSWAPHCRGRTESAIRIRAPRTASHRGQAARGGRRYFEERLETASRRHADRLIGGVNDEAKVPFWRGPRRCYFLWIGPTVRPRHDEAMACGTPVTLSAPAGLKVIDKAAPGSVVDDEEQAVQAVKRLGELDRRRVRDRFEERFTAGRMATDYVSHYQSVVNGGSEYRRRALPAGEESAAPAT